MTFTRLTIASALLLLLGCTTAPQATPPAGLAVLDADRPVSAMAQPDAASTMVHQEPAGQQDTRASQEPRLLRGDDVVVAAPTRQPAVQGTAHAFKFEEAPISEVVHVMLRDILKVSYVLHQPVAGTVTLATKGPVSADDALAMLESALLANGLVMVRDTRGTYHVGKAEVVRNIGTSVRQPLGKGPLPPGYGAIVVPLQYIGAAEMAAILKPLMPADALVRVDTTRNLLVLVGTRVQAEGWLDMVSTFDVNLLKGMSVGVFPLKNVTAAEVEAALQLLGSAGAGAAVPPATPVAGGTASATAAAPVRSAAKNLLNAEDFPLRGAIRVMPIERINSILVVTPRAAYLDEARRWIEKLDQPGGAGGEAGLHIYKVQNGNARHLASVLSGIFGGGQPAAPAASSGVAPGLATGVATTFGQQQSQQPFGSGMNGGFGAVGTSNF
ncbi:MAG: secretin N-terminal domain-containing protein, partial [Comamonas sp.]